MTHSLPLRLLRHGATILFARIVVGAVFVYASHDKILYPEAFAESIKNYDMLPYEVLAPFGVVLPWVELFAGLFLIFGFWTQASSLIISGMLAMFIIALGQAVGRGLDIECGCFVAEGGSQAGWRKIFEDIGLLILAVLPLLWGAPRWSVDRFLASRDSRE